MSIQNEFEDAAWNYTNGNFARAAELFESLLGQKHGPSATYYAQLYQNGEGVSQDMIRAVELLQLGIEWGDPIAAYNLGAMYWSGIHGLERDRSKAKQYFQTAKKMGCELELSRFLAEN